MNVFKIRASTLPDELGFRFPLNHKDILPLFFTSIGFKFTFSLYLIKLKLIIVLNLKYQLFVLVSNNILALNY